MAAVIRVVLAIAVCALSQLALPLVASAAKPAPAVSDPGLPIAFLDAGVLEISLTPKVGEALTATVAVAVRNDGAADVALSFQLAVTNGQGATVQLDAPTASDPTVGAHSVKPITLTITGKADAGDLSGFLIASAPGLPVATRPVSISVPATPPAHLALLIIGLAGAAALVTFAFVALSTQGRKDFSRRLGVAQFSKDSWATTIAGAGGIVGAIGAGTGFLPEDTKIMTKGEFAALALLFAALPLLAAFFYATFTTIKRGDAKAQEQGFVGTFVIAGSITVGAVVGQISTLIALIVDASAVHVATSISVAFYSVFAVAALLSVIYGITQIRRKIATRRAKRGPARQLSIEANGNFLESEETALEPVSLL